MANLDKVHRYPYLMHRVNAMFEGFRPLTVQQYLTILRNIAG